jgi:hypothetical protein
MTDHSLLVVLVVLSVLSVLMERPGMDRGAVGAPWRDGETVVWSCVDGGGSGSGGDGDGGTAIPMASRSGCARSMMPS